MNNVVIIDNKPHIKFGDYNLSLEILEFIRYRLARFQYPEHFARKERDTDYYGDLANGVKTNIDPSFPTQGNSLGKSLAPYLDYISLRDIDQGRVPSSVFCSLKQGEFAGYPSNGFFEMLENAGFDGATTMNSKQKKGLVNFLRQTSRSQITSMTSFCVFSKDVIEG